MTRRQRRLEPLDPEAIHLADFCHRHGLSYQRSDETENPERTYENPQDGVVAALRDFDRSVL